MSNKIQHTRFDIINIPFIYMNKLSIFTILLLVLSVAAQEAEDQQYLQMRRTACVILSRMHSNTQKDVIEEVIQGL
jgi:hypothetical protein